LTKKTLTCVVPARNEAGYLKQLISTILSVKEIDKVIIVEGGSSDNTYEVANKVATSNPNRVKCVRQSGQGKFNAVLEGFNLSDSDFIMIWDADGTVPVKSTREIILRALERNCFSMGDRLRGQREAGAMQLANFVGNWFFAIIWAPINWIKPTDIFCGTKVFPSGILKGIPEHFVTKDPYGDISFLIAARITGIKVSAVPVAYTSRVYGESKMRRWKMGYVFMKLTLASYGEILGTHKRSDRVPN